MIAGGAALMAAGQVLLASATRRLGVPGPGADRCRRRCDVHLRDPAGRDVVPRAPGPAADPAERRAGAGRPGRLGVRATRGGAARARVDDGVRAASPRSACSRRLLAVLAVRDAPAGRRGGRVQPGACSPRCVAAAREPGTWLGFWSHALTQFPLNVFLLLWGFPFLIGRGAVAAAAGEPSLTVAVVASVVSGPVIGDPHRPPPVAAVLDRARPPASASLAAWVGGARAPGPRPPVAARRCWRRARCRGPGSSSGSTSRGRSTRPRDWAPRPVW